MRKDLAIIAMPFDIGIGGYYRAYQVVPRLAKLFYEHDYSSELIIPTNGFRTLINQVMQREGNINLDLGTIESIIEKYLYDIYKMSKNSLYINEKLVKKSIEFLYKTYSRSTNLAKMTVNMLLPDIKPFFIYKLENQFFKQFGYQKKFKYLYSLHETLDALAVLNNVSTNSAKLAILLQLDIKGISAVYFSSLLKNIVYKKSKLYLLSVSPAPLIETRTIWNVMNRYNIKYDVIIPANAVDEELIKIRKTINEARKENNQAIYFGRISPEKGFYDLIKAWKHIENRTNGVKLIIVGICDTEKIKLELYKKLQEVDRAKYIGIIRNRQVLYKLVASSSILLYPSYRDAFPLTVLEALVLNLNIVAYDIPALRFPYKKVPKIKLVPKGNYILLAKEAIKILKEGLPVNDHITRKIIEMHDSWDKVAYNEFKKIYKFFTK